ncbi:MAG: hypothetical protein LBH16_03295 [Treponema sp.]|jgi:hypothetical protein|nr:hypothetical protein [Treponema sp.]
MNKIYRFSAAIFAIILCAAHSVYARESSETDKVEFNIRFIERKIYYAQTDPVMIQITITNNGPQTYRFKLADERAFSLDFDIRTLTNRPLAQSDTLIRKRNQNNQVFFREISIERGESFSFIEDLRDYISLKQPGSFRVRAYVYPELLRTTSYSLQSNYLALNLRPAIISDSDGIPADMDAATGAVLVRQPLPPDEVVTYMLKARQTSQWAKFFLYLDIEAMLSRDPYQKRKWMAENEDGRRRMAEDYRKTLQNSTVDEISIIPTWFNIERTEYHNTEGIVTVLAKFRNDSFTSVVIYKYYLERRDNIWIIVNYSTESRGTEANE